MNKPLKGFITYSHEDIEAKDELRKRLAVMEQQSETIEDYSKAIDLKPDEC